MHTRSILISYAGYPFTPSSLMPDNGLANLAGALIQAGHQTLVLDYGTVDTVRRLYPRSISQKTYPIYRNMLEGSGKKARTSLKDMILLNYLGRKLERFQDKVVEHIASEVVEHIAMVKPDFVGFKLWNGDGFTGSIKIAEAVKKAYPSLKIFAGGPHADIFKGHIHSATDVFDVLVYAEGEAVLPLLCEYCKGKIDLSEIPNVIYRRGPKIHVNEIKWIENLDSLPFAVYDEEVYPSMKGNQKIKIVVIDESRGCPNRCAFCIQPIKSGQRLRLKSPQRVTDEIKSIMRSHGVTAFRYAGSTTPLKHAVDIANSILKQNLDITYTSFGHVQKSSDSEYEILKASGCYSIFFGIESGSSDILHRGFGKKIDPALIRDTLTACRKAGIFTVGSMIFPGPFETDETERESLQFILEVKPDAVPVQFPGIVPETEWRLNPGKYNFRLTCRDYEKAVIRYKIKFLYPPAYWDPVPYHVNRMSYRKFTRKTDDFVRKLESGGILTHITDDQALMAFHAGYRGREKVFREQLRLSYAAGDIESIEEIVNKINSSVVKSA